MKDVIVWGCLFVFRDDKEVTRLSNLQHDISSSKLQYANVFNLLFELLLFVTIFHIIVNLTINKEK